MENTKKTRVVNVRRDHFDVYIGRTMPGYITVGLGNPYFMGFKNSNRLVACLDYLKLFRVEMGLGLRANPSPWNLPNPHFVELVESCRGKVLGCWCAPSLCHGDIIATFLNEGVAGLHKLQDQLAASVRDDN